ncbi:MAG: hypothetical protein ACJ741_13845 [Pyrinomonadaceae bacterium]
MELIFSIITAVVIATSAGGDSTINGDAGSTPAPPGAAEQDQRQCLAPCTYDEATDTYICPC